MIGFCSVPPSSALVVSSAGFFGDVNGLRLLTGLQREVHAQFLGTSKVMFGRSMVLKPLNSARTLYIARCRDSEPNKRPRCRS